MASSSRRVYKLPFAVSDEVDPASVSALPPSHFLSQAIPALRSDADQSAADSGGRLDLSTLASADFDIDVASGFLPPSPPLRRFPQASPWELWEFLWEESAMVKLGSEQVLERDREIARQWRHRVKAATVISDDGLNTMELLRRGHVVLAFLAHRYMHSFDQSMATTTKELPASISVPWLSISSRLDMPAVLTYADTVLWNWDYIDPSKGLIPEYAHSLSSACRIWLTYVAVTFKWFKLSPILALKNGSILHHYSLNCKASQLCV